MAGQISIGDNGLSLQCDYSTIKKLAKVEALKMGGNCIVITEHTLPNQRSTCHRIKADVLLISNAQEFESEITWHEKRKLKIEDFKGSTEKRPFTAATASSFRARYEARPATPNRFKVYIETYFDCYSSYFKRTEADSVVLAHEQIHFDISELYSRKLLQRIESEISSQKELQAKSEKILTEIGRELHIKQDEYDSEVYADPQKQIEWNNWIDKELLKNAKYSSGTLIVK
ncbi:MAG: hypothetical protein AB8F78_16240 [Saprospiraceae bacterium]